MTVSFIYLVPHLFQVSIHQIKSTAMKLSAAIKTFMQTNQDLVPIVTSPVQEVAIILSGY